MTTMSRIGRPPRTEASEPDAFLPLTPLSYHILLAVADQSRHGYGIIKEIEAGTGGATSPSTGALYLALQRMEGEGLVAGAPAPRGEPDDDPRRKYYRLTPLGRRVAVAESRRLAELVALAAEKRLTGGGHG
jgi:DNA-binding PadR family transcriptional regulator